MAEDTMIHVTVMESSPKSKSFLRPASEAFAMAEQMTEYSRIAVYTGINHSQSNETRVIYSLPDLIYYSVKEPYEKFWKELSTDGKKPAVNWW